MGLTRGQYFQNFDFVKNGPSSSFLTGLSLFLSPITFKVQPQYLTDPALENNGPSPIFGTKQNSPFTIHNRPISLSLSNTHTHSTHPNTHKHTHTHTPTHTPLHTSTHTSQLTTRYGEEIFHSSATIDSQFYAWTNNVRDISI